MNDTKTIVKWRNSIMIKDFSYDNKVISIDDHKKWYKSTRKYRYDYIFCDIENQVPIGCMSYKISKYLKKGVLNKIEMGKYIGEEDYLGRGFAQEATKKWLEIGHDYFKFNKIFVVTNKKNKVNIHINKKLGFRFVSFAEIKDPEWVIMEKSK
tara:strand:+ start:153 stop:611 length:459 start_codon:yes stop_codon:yes gene_type:complete